MLTYPPARMLPRMIRLILVVLTLTAALCGCESTTHISFDTQVKLAVCRGTTEQLLLDHHLPVGDAKRIAARLEGYEEESATALGKHDKRVMNAARRGVEVEQAYVDARARVK